MKIAVQTQKGVTLIKIGKRTAAFVLAALFPFGGLFACGKIPPRGELTATATPPPQTAAPDTPSPTSWLTPYTPRAYTADDLFGTAGSLSWRIDVDSKTLYISGQGEMPDYDEERPPWWGFGVAAGTGYGDDPNLYRNLVVEEGVTKIGAYAFVGNWYDSVQLPDSLTEIGEGGFRACGAKVFEIPKNVQKIGDMAFFWNWITAFAVSEDSEFFCAADGVLYDKAVTRLYAYPTQRAGSRYELPSTVTTVSAYAFTAWDLQTDLFVIVLPEGLTTLEASALDHGYALAKAELPQSLSAVGDRAFAGLYTNVLILPDGIESLPHAVFSGSGVEQIVLPTTVIELNAGTFFGAHSMKQVYFLGKPPKLLPLDDEKINPFFSEKNGDLLVLYYPRSLSAFWSPNGETEWNGFKILPCDELPEFSLKHAETLDDWVDEIWAVQP